MNKADDFTGWPEGPIHLAIGVFDGVHLGHQAIIKKLALGAREVGAVPVAATFDPLPIQLLAPASPPSALSDIQDRSRLLAEAGASTVVVFGFNREFAGLTAQDFIERVMAAGDVRRIVVGSDFRFGNGRAGDVKLMRELTVGRAQVEEFAQVEVRRETVSSTRIRNALVAGEVQLAAKLLGRPYDVAGTVVHGEKRGRGLGFPTINIATPPQRLLPKDGIYAVWATVGGTRHGAAASLGLRPTFGGTTRLLEAYLLDFNGDLYDREVRAEFITRLRDEIHFDGPEALAERIAIDVTETRSALNPGPSKPS